MQERPTPGQLFKHQDGGYYRYLGMVRHSDDPALLVRYEHVWPFETVGDQWVRPVSEWDSRFTTVSEAAFQTAVQQDRTEAQEEVARAKALRRAKKEVL